MPRIKQLRYLLFVLFLIPFFVFVARRSLLLTTATKQTMPISPIAENVGISQMPTTIVISPTIVANTVYPRGANGYAISWPQCGKKYPDTPYDFGIIGVTGGYSSNNNPCLQSELQWAKKAPYQPSFYINMDFPAFLNKALLQSFPCEAFDEQCIAYHYGYYTGDRAYTYALSQSATSQMWWLDVQIVSSWSNNKAINAQVLLGAIAFFQQMHLGVGLSTTPYQWQTVVGDLSTNLPNWIPGMINKEAASLYCTSGKSYSGGYVKQLAYIANGFEAVYACGN